MKYNYKEHWTKLNEDTDKYEEISKEEYEQAIFPAVDEMMDDLTNSRSMELLTDAVDGYATALNFFLASAEEIEGMKAAILSDFRSKCIDEIEWEKGYQHWQETYFFY